MLTQLGQDLLAQAPPNPYRFEFVLAQSDSINADAVPGGRIVVYTGLIHQMESVDELAGVLGHEIQHILQRHSLQKLLHTMALPLAGYLLLGDFYRPDIAGRLTEMHFSRSEESEADRKGIQLAAAAGFDPHGLARFFKRGSGAASTRLKAAFLSSHPTDARRSRLLSDIAAQLPPAANAQPKMNWKELKERCANVKAKATPISR